MQELSQWFNLSEQKPWVKGVYEVEFKSLFGGNRIAKSYFDGSRFNFLSHEKYGFCVETAFEKRRNSGGGERVFRWRGLSSASSKPAPSSKPRGNRRVTRYVVMAKYAHHGYGLPYAVFSKKENADAYVEAEQSNHFHKLSVRKIRFRTPEASQV